MNQDELALTVAEYKDAIDKLEVYQAKEPDQVKSDKAGKKITEYRDKIIDAAWGAITSRTDALNALVADLRAITDRASNVPQLADALGQLNGAVTKAAKLASGQELECKTCGVKVVFLSNAVVAVAGTGNRIKVNLTCKNGHTNEYEVNAS